MEPNKMCLATYNAINTIRYISNSYQWQQKYSRVLQKQMLEQFWEVLKCIRYFILINNVVGWECGNTYWYLLCFFQTKVTQIGLWTNPYVCIFYLAMALHGPKLARVCSNPSNFAFKPLLRIQTVHGQERWWRERKMVSTFKIKYLRI